MPSNLLGQPSVSSGHFFRFEVVAADATEVLSVGKSRLILYAGIIYTVGTPAPAAFKYDSAAGTLTVSNHTAGTSFYVVVRTE